jgi:hypothetical protein
MDVLRDLSTVGFTHDRRKRSACVGTLDSVGIDRLFQQIEDEAWKVRDHTCWQCLMIASRGGLDSRLFPRGRLDLVTAVPIRAYSQSNRTV